VIPLTSETLLRRANEAEWNRRRVEEISEGRLGYIYIGSHRLPDFHEFQREYLANRKKQGLIIDQRHNSGGTTPDAIIELLARQPLYYYQFREGDDLEAPVNGRIEPSTILLINQENGSAAETFALMFQVHELGRIVGLRTFGAGIGPYGHNSYPPFVDGGTLRVPSRAAYNPAGTWDIENHGIEPDFSVDLLPADWRSGHDPQLEMAITKGLEAIGEAPRSSPKRPPFPVHPGRNQKSFDN
jgi:tricorn protease